MIPHHKTEIPHVLTLFTPEAASPVLVDSPHSGRIYPDDFGFTVAYDDLIQAEDRFMELLVADAPNFGHTLLQAEFPRTYIDANRAVDDIDLALVPEWCGPLGTHNCRSSSGIGLIRRLLKSGVPMYDRALSPPEVEQRIKTYYEPYHAQLQTALDALHYKFGYVFYLNVHSMPMDPAGIGPDIVLGDLDGKACDPHLTILIKNQFQSMGYKVKLNDPYKGAECLRRHGQPAQGKMALQLEICKSLYLNSKDINESKFNKLKTDINSIFEWLSVQMKPQAVPLAAD